MKKKLIDDERRNKKHSQMFMKKMCKNVSKSDETGNSRKV